MDPALRQMTRHKSEYVRLLGQLVRKFQAGHVPREDFEQLTTTPAFGFDNQRRATPATVDALRRYLDAIEEPVEVPA